MFVNNIQVYDGYVAHYALFLTCVHVFGEYVAGDVWRKGLKRCIVYQCYNAEHQAVAKRSVCVAVH